MFYFDTDKRLLEIFSEHCALSPEQYEELSAQLIYLVADIQDNEPKEEIEKRINYLRAIIEFLYNTKELTMQEHYELGEMIEQIMEKAAEVKA